MIISISCQTLVYATIKKQALMQLEASANIFIHDVSTTDTFLNMKYLYMIHTFIHDINTYDNQIAIIIFISFHHSHEMKKKSMILLSKENERQNNETLNQ